MYIAVINSLHSEVYQDYIKFFLVDFLVAASNFYI